ncbi:MAG: class I SAM-dependent methyltransferase [Planctomycetes bacterium]|nr:class I SAM-dependent methyltransferase [Planctomycetota bacterium]
MTLPRVLEPEVMDTLEEAQDYDSMDHSEVNRVFVADLLQTGTVDCDILDLGTGTALLPIELCKQADDCRVMAVDLSVNMLDLARYNIEADGMIEQIQLAHVDAKDLPYDDGMFQLVISNSIVHHIPSPLQALREAVRVTASGGRLFFRDLLRPADDETVRHLVSTYAGDENDHQRQMFEDSLRAALTVDEVRELVGELGFPADSVNPTSDRHWTWSSVKTSK